MTTTNGSDPCGSFDRCPCGAPAVHGTRNCIGCTPPPQTIEQLAAIPVVRVFVGKMGGASVKAAKNGDVKMARAAARAAAHYAIAILRKNVGDEPTVGIPLTYEVGR
jgi:hypothetical protein